MKRAKMNNKGFTLVELIVVLVILAILAAVLVPTLLGYIDRAKSEKDYSTAQSIRVATQSIVAELYAQEDDGILEGSQLIAQKDKILQLIGAQSGSLDGTTVDITAIEMSGDKQNQITGMTVVIGGKNYVLNGNTWSAGSASTGGSGSGEGEGAGAGEGE